MLNHIYFAVLNPRMGPRTTDLFASKLNALCETFFFKHSRCLDTSDVNVFGFSWGGFNNLIHPPFWPIDYVIRRLGNFSAIARLIAPVWESLSWWNVLAPDGVHFAEITIDWTWLPTEDPALFLPGQRSGNNKPTGHAHGTY
jgi:hypothetical protein